MDNTTPNTMDKPWLIAAFKPLDVSKFPYTPHSLLEKYDEWLPKFNGMNAINAEKHMHELYWVVRAKLIMEEDVVMMLFSLTLERNVRDWYLTLPQGSLINWVTFQQAFDKRWPSK